MLELRCEALDSIGSPIQPDDGGGLAIPSSEREQASFLQESGLFVPPKKVQFLACDREQCHLNLASCEISGSCRLFAALCRCRFPACLCRMT